MTVNTGLVIVPLLLRVFDHGVVLGASLLLELCNYHIPRAREPCGYDCMSVLLGSMKLDVGM